MKTSNNMETTKFCEYCTSRGVRHKKVCTRPLEVSPHEMKPLEAGPDIKELQEKIELLEKRDIERQEKVKMLEDVADKGRVFNYQNRKSTKKPMKVALSVYEESIIIGWRTAKDILIKNPTTGLTVGEEQEIEILLLDKEDKVRKEMVQGYPRFSEIRYMERIEAEVVGKKEDWEGKFSFDLLLPDGRQIELAEQFLN